jgi:hypothetical protein
MTLSRWTILTLIAACFGFGLWQSGVSAQEPTVPPTAEQPPTVQPAQRTASLLLRSVQIQRTKADGSAWDVDEGAPDPQVTIKNRRSGRTLTTQAAQDTFSATFPAGIEALEVSPGDVLEIRVVDDDAAVDDVAGESEKAITAEMLAKPQLDLSFGQVERLRFDVQPRAGAVQP